MNTETGALQFAGAWRRIGAFVIDIFVLGLIGIGLGYVFFDALVATGRWGHLVGFLLAMAYFVPLDSTFGKGRTLGKHLLKIKVIRTDGAVLPLHVSLLRFAIIGIPWFLNGAWLPAPLLAPPWIYVLALLVFGAGLSLFYLFLFNRPSRRSLQDLATGTVVVNAEHVQPVVVPPLARVHTIAVPVIAALSLLLPAFTTRLVEQEMWAPLMLAYERVNADPMVLHAQVNRGFMARGDKRTTYLQVTAYLSEPRIDDGEIARRLALPAIQADPSAMNLDVVQVVLVYGYDIGIAAGHRSYAHDKTAAEWLQ